MTWHGTVDENNYNNMRFYQFPTEGERENHNSKGISIKPSRALSNAKIMQSNETIGTSTKLIYDGSNKDVVANEGEYDSRINIASSSHDEISNEQKLTRLRTDMPREFMEKAAVFRNKIKTSFVSNHESYLRTNSGEDDEDFDDPVTPISPLSEGHAELPKSDPPGLQMKADDKVVSVEGADEPCTNTELTRDSHQEFSKTSSNISQSLIAKAASFQNRFKESLPSRLKKQSRDFSDQLNEENTVDDPQLEDGTTEGDDKTGSSFFHKKKKFIFTSP
mmetsp:Transcript_18564/g.28067  ORF Transcript_18564/g.28067 Transcript_18564/m.28067 type:complete len:277 (+) Transcript_18564:25-855(+)